MEKVDLSSIIDFSDKLGENPNAFCFNPSIAHWKNNLYLVCYRTFVREPNIEKNPVVVLNKNKFNHPWFGLNSWATGKDGYDKTGFCIVRIENNIINLFQPLNDGNSLYYFKDGEFYPSKDIHIIGKDARLIKTGENSFLVSYNQALNRNIEVKTKNCIEGCILIVTRVINLINHEDGEKLYMYDETVLCPEISEETEKNWSLFKYNNQYLFSYGLSPTHIIYSFFIFKEEAKCGVHNWKDDHEYFGNYEKAVNPKNGQLLHISVSTPSIPSIENPNRYLGVGYVKFKNKRKQISQIKSKELKDFIILKKEMKRHDKYDYLMFIYEFDPSNGKIYRVSDMFIPEESEYLLVFPTGLIYIGENLWIFYGDHDSNCNAMIINNEYVSKILKEVPNNKSAFSSTDINYFLFPRSCYTKEAICRLLLNI